MELERKKLGPERVLDEDLIARSNRLLNNRLKSTEFKENGKFLNDVGNYSCDEEHLIDCDNVH
jgi:hypothetical protein